MTMRCSLSRLASRRARPIPVSPPRVDDSPTAGLPQSRAGRATHTMSPRGPLVLAVAALINFLPAMPPAFGQAETDAEAGVAIAEPGIDRAVAVETFDRVWTLIRDTHFDPDLNGVDWQAARDELRPKAASAADMDELRDVIQDLIARLGQSHFALIPGEVSSAINSIGEKDASETVVAEGDQGDNANPDQTDGDDNDATGGEGDVGLDVRVADGQLVVWKVDPGSPADKAGVQPGWVIDRIGSTEVSSVLDRWPDDSDNRMLAYQLWNALTYRFGGEVGTSVEVAFLNQNDESVTLTLKRRPVQGTKVTLGGLPPMYADLTSERLSRADYGAEVGLIAFSVWMTPIARPFDAALDTLRDCDGIVIDLRGNPGGIGFMTTGIAGHFLAEPISLGTMVTREMDLEFRVNPRFASPTGERVTPFAGPVAVLVDGFSASTSEIFVAGLQDLGRVRVFGQTTLGAALPAWTSGLPNGDVLLHAVGDFIPPSGTSVEGRGVTPDVEVPVRRDDLLAGRDAPLLAAIAWIAEEASADSTPASAAPASVGNRN